MSMLVGKFARALATILVAATALLASPAHATDQPHDVGTQADSYGRFLEIDQLGWLVQWNKVNGSWTRTRIGPGWTSTKTRRITSLDANHFLEITEEGLLSEWTWNGATYTEAVQGSGWHGANTQSITGLDRNTFLEIQFNGWLSRWTRTSNGWSEFPVGPGWAWYQHGTHDIAGLTTGDFIEITYEGGLSEWLSDGTGYRERSIFPPPYAQDATLIAGVDRFTFVVVFTAGFIAEYSYTGTGQYNGTLIGGGGRNIRLLG